MMILWFREGLVGVSGENLGAGRSHSFLVLEVVWKKGEKKRSGQHLQVSAPQQGWLSYLLLAAGAGDLGLLPGSPIRGMMPPGF